MSSVVLEPIEKQLNEIIYLPSSKSESNRALIINALCQPQGELTNISSARDTQTMLRLLASDEQTANVIDAGTTMRFLTAYFSVTNQQKLLTGTDRMCERPIGILVDALREIGVEIEYQKKEGYPPHKIGSFENQLKSSIAIPGNVSSQYISALLMIAPNLPNGLHINIDGEVGSKPYITMTIELMKSFGVDVNADWDKQVLSILPQKYLPTSYQIESDWSGASYWYSVVALSLNEDSTVELIGLKENSLQGDSKIVEIMKQLGVESKFTAKGVQLTKIKSQENFVYDFTNCPDLVQTVAVICAIKGVDAAFTGIESLKIKETDRVLALQNELKKIGIEFNEVEENHKYCIPKQAFCKPIAAFETYDDHRMAMAFAPIAMQMGVTILEPNVVVKSYPSFWEDFSKVCTLKIN